MSLKFHVETLDGLEESIKALYSPSKEGGFQLAVEGIEDPAELRRARDHEKEARKAAQTEARALKDKVTELADKLDQIDSGRAKKRGDIDALEESYKKKIADLETAHQTDMEKMKGTVNTLLVDNVAHSIAQEISTAPELILPHIKARLKAEDGASGPETRVVDAKGQLSALTVDDLKNEFKQNDRYAPIIIGSKASGGGASNNGKGGGAAKPFAEMTGPERTELFNKNRAEFDRQNSAHQEAIKKAAQQPKTPIQSRVQA